MSKNRFSAIGLLILATLFAPQLISNPASAQDNSGSMLFLIEASGGPGFTSPDQALAILENAIIPGFDMLMGLQNEGTIVAGGLRVGQRSVVFIMKAASNDEVDQVVRGLPFWGALQWKVTPLQTFAGRAEIERGNVATIKANR